MTMMEPGETLTITASLSTTTFVALRARTNTEVTLRISPPGGCSSPVITKRNTPRASSFKLSSSPVPKQPLVHKDSTTELIDKSALQGWVMVSTQQPLSCWNIAWVTATTSPTSKICVKLESEVDSKYPSTSLNFEEIDTIVELESHDTVQGAGDPVKFEIKTKSNNIYKILTNSFMTVGMRDFMQSTLALATLNSTTTSTSPSRGSLRLPKTPSKKSIASKDTLSRVNTPKPPSHLPIPNFSTTVNIPPKPSSKTSLSRTNTPLPEFSKPTTRATIPSSTTRRLQVKSSSLETIPIPATHKAAPRPISFNVYDHIQRNLDSPKPKDSRDKIRIPSKPNKALLKLNHSAVRVATSILTECAKLQKCEDESDFSTWDSEDGASDFSEVEENLSEWENAMNCCGLDQLTCLNDFCDKIDSDFEIRDLCEMSKGLSPEINITLGCHDDDNSSCFSEDMSEIDCSIIPDSLDDISSDYFSSDRSTIMSSISSSCVFDGANEKNHKGLRGLQKMIVINKSDTNSPVMNDKFKTGKWEQKQMKRMEKEAKRAARLNKILEKKEKKEKEKKREKGSASPKKPLSVRVKGCVRKFFGKSDVKQCIEGQ